MKSILGHSLIELLVTIAVVICVLSTGVPQLSRLKDSTMQRSTANDLLSALHFARNHAISARNTISLCHGASTCVNNEVWQGALMVFTDSNGNGSIDGSDALLRSIPIPGGYTWRWSGFRSKTRISYATDGTTLAMNGTFTLCQGSSPTRQIIISLSGRPRVQAPASGAKCN